MADGARAGSEPTDAQKWAVCSENRQSQNPRVVLGTPGELHIDFSPKDTVKLAHFNYDGQDLQN